MSGKESATGTNRQVCILLVEPNQELGAALAQWLQSRNSEVLRAASAKEAHAALHEARLNGKQCDGLLTDSSALGFAVYGVMSAFQGQFPGRPVAAMAVPGDLLIGLWAGAHDVHVLRKPFSMPILAMWCDRARNGSSSRNGGNDYEARRIVRESCPRH